MARDKPKGDAKPTDTKKVYGEEEKSAFRGWLKKPRGRPKGSTKGRKSTSRPDSNSNSQITGKRVRGGSKSKQQANANDDDGANSDSANEEIADMVGDPTENDSESTSAADVAIAEAAAEAQANLTRGLDEFQLVPRDEEGKAKLSDTDLLDHMAKYRNHMVGAEPSSHLALEIWQGSDEGHCSHRGRPPPRSNSEGCYNGIFQEAGYSEVE